MKILAADDTPAILDVLRQILETEGYDVVTAPDGQEVQMGVHYPTPTHEE